MLERTKPTSLLNNWQISCRRRNLLFVEAVRTLSLLPHIEHSKGTCSGAISKHKYNNVGSCLLTCLVQLDKARTCCLNASTWYWLQNSR